MKILSIKDFKAQFSTFIKWMKANEEIMLTYGKKKHIVGVFKKVTIEKLATRKIGIYDNMKGYKMAEDFNETSQKEFPN